MCCCSERGDRVLGWSDLACLSHFIFGNLSSGEFQNCVCFFFVFICFVLAACTHLALLHYNPIINVLKFCDDFYKPVAKFRILYGCVQLYSYMPPRFTFAKCACDILIGVLLSCNILTSFIADGPKVIL